MDSYWFVVLVISMAVHLSSGNTVVSSTSPTLFMSLSSADFMQGRVLGTVEARGENPIFRIEHSEACPEDVFDIGQSNGQLSLLRTVDFSSGTLTPQCRTNGEGDYLISIQTFYCTVIESNQNGIPVVINVIPVLGSTHLTFPEAFYRGAVVEGVENATVIVSADNHAPLTAQTQPVNGLVSPQYRTIGEYASSFRVISRRDSCQSYPSILTTHALRRTEKSLYYEVTVEAFSNTHSATTVISIEVLDVNDQSPQFVDPMSTLMLSEDTPLGIEAVQFNATDDDSGLNSDVRFSISPINSSFTIHPLTGYLSLYAPLDFERRESVEVMVSASDLGNPSLTTHTSITIFTSNANELPPQINVENLGQLSIAENAPLGREVTTFTVADSDSSVITVTIANIGPASYFRLEGDTPNHYRVLVNSALDFESAVNGVYSIILTAEDDGGLATETRVEITVMDENEQPYFPQSLYEAEVREGVPTGSVVFGLSALDPDTGASGELTYSLSSTSPLASLFDVHSESGSVFTTGDIDYEMLSVKSLTFTVTASDGQLSNTTMLTLHILDENDNVPTFTAPKVNITIMESHDADTHIHIFSASDLDSGCNGAVEYSVLHSEPQNVFQVDSFSGHLYLTSDSALSSNDFESAVVVVRATDLGDRWSHSAECTLYITITPTNTNPPVLDSILCPCFIREEASGQECFQLTAFDPDSSDLEFRILNNEQGRFEIDSRSGIVRPVGMLDREDRAEYVLEVVVSDGTFDSEPQNLTITVVDINDNQPSFSSSRIPITAPVDLVAGDYIGSAAATDSDMGFNALINHQFQSSTASSITSDIKIDPLSGKLFAKRTLSQTTYTFTVSATSLILPSHQASAEISITVTGEKNNPPYFEVSTERFTVASELAVGMTVATLSAIDMDSGANGNLQYSIVQESSNHSNLFSINSTGTISSVGSLSGLAGSTYSLNVSVADGGSPSYTAYQEVIITVYESVTNIGQNQLVYNPTVAPCHHVGQVIELLDSANVPVVAIPRAQGTQTASISILDSEFSSAFGLNVIPHIATITTQAGFGNVFSEREAIYLQVRAIYGSNFHLCSVTVRIIDINNNAPQFDEETYSFDVFQVTPIGSSVFQVSATDADVGTNAQPGEYRIRTTSTPFTIDQSTGEIEVSRLLEQNSYIFEVLAVDNRVDGQPTATATVQVTVVEATNRSPSLTPINSNVTVPESMFGQITTVTLDDSTDRGGFAANRFCIASGNVKDVFLVTSGSSGGEIRVRTGLDFETQPATFNLVIMAHDGTPNPAWQSTVVTVNVQDVNDVAPQFTTPSYTAVVAEDAPVSTPVILVHANDRDTGPGGEVRYSLHDTSVFSIDPQSGLITTFNELNSKSYSLTVSATDQGFLQQTGQSTVVITVRDVNDITPSFTTLNLPQSFSEDSSIGFPVLMLEARDDDEGANGEVKYSIVSGNEDFVFHLDPWTGVVTLAKEVDYEVDSLTYTITFQVQDLGTPDALTGSRLTITLNVVDVNDNYPVFSSQLYECSIMEGNSGTFNPACEVSAVDNDRTGSTLQYSLLDTDVPFTVSNGVISRSGSIDRETNSQFVLRVQAQDSGTPPKSSVALVRISILDQNDDVPTFSRLNTFHISEQLPLNTLLFYSRATDSDLGENSEISYSLLAGEGFRLDTTTGAVFLNRQLDFESQPTHSIAVVASNPAGTQGSQSYTLNVIDINENSLPPIFPETSNPSVVSVLRDTPVDTVVATLTAEDPDPPTGEPSLTYYTVGGSAYGYFKINVNTGVVTTDFSLRNIEETTLRLEVIALDGGPYSLSTRTVLIIELTTAADSAPLLVEPVFTVVLAITDRGHVISTVRAEVDGYHDPAVCYNITSGNDPGYFAINSSTGVISSTVGPGQFEEGVPYSLIVRAFKPSVTGTSDALVLITFNNTNPFSPGFRSGGYDLFLVENYPVDSSMAFVRVFARDDNFGENGRLTYTLQNEESLPFGISPTTGDMYLTASLDGTSDTTPSHTVTVMVTDHGEPMQSASTTFTITVVAPVEATAATPSFPAQTSLVVSEDTAVNFASLRTLRPSNSIPHTLMYHIRDRPTEFTISPNTGEIYLTTSLDFETATSYNLIIDVWDGTHSIITITIPVVVMDTNDNRPQFTSSLFEWTVTEDSSNGDPVNTATALDRDSPANQMLSYSIIDSLPPQSASVFSLSSTGSLTISGTLDHEEIPVHVLTIAVEDSGGLLDYARVVVTVQDTDDNLPQFLYPLSVITVREDVANGSVVHTVVTFDPDTGSNAQNVYRLQSEDDTFAILATTGELIVNNRTLDAETQTQYSLTVIAENIHKLGATSQISLTVNVVDVLDSIPALPSMDAIVQENLPAYSQVASFYDSSNTQPVYYSIVGGNEQGRFFIEPVTGVLRTSVPLDREQESEYILTIRGSFGHGLERDQLVNVTVGDENDNPPLFPSAFLELDIPETPFVPMLELNITDPDQGTNAEISSCLIKDGVAAEYFSVDTNGYLQLSEPLNRSHFESITFDLYCIDSGVPPQYSRAQIKVNVVDTNNHIPQFEQPSYTFTVSTPTLIDITQFTVRAVDNDLGAFAQVRYSLVGGSGISKFAISSTTGEVSLRDNYGLQSSYGLVVMATDGEWSSSVSVEVLVKECGFQQLHFRPDFIRVEILENRPVNSIVIRPDAFRLLEFAQLSTYDYSITMSVFNVDPETGEVFVSEDIDRETREVYQLVLQATDRSNTERIAQGDVEITLLDENDNTPMFVSSYVGFVRNNETAGYQVLRVQATDRDKGANAEISYSILDDTSNVFAIDEDTGQVSLSTSIGGLSLSSIENIVVQATDGGANPLSSTVSIDIHIVDSNAPRFTMDTYSVDVYENATLGETVITVQALSITPEITYSLSDDTLPFEIDRQNGMVKVRDPGLNYELRSSYVLTVIAEDSSTSSLLSGRAGLEITVLDVNDNTPVFESGFYTVQVNEDVSTPYIIQEVSATATDRDSPSNAEITYIIKDNLFADKFSVDRISGVLSIVSSLDYEQVPVYQFDLLATDSGSPARTGSATIRIGLTNVNDNPPEFTQLLYTVSVSETAQPGTNLFLFVTALDADNLGPLVYSIVPDVPGHENFEVTSNGLLVLNSQSVSLTEPSYELNVSASDGVFLGFTTVVVQVQDSNDHSPEFNQSEYLASITENAGNQFVTQVFASDMDQGTNAEIIYSITTTAFQIDPQSGVITASTPIDREENPSFVFSVVGRDGGGRTGRANVMVTVEDLNDNSPMFSQTRYEGTAVEDSQPGTQVVTITATDQDSGDNGRVVYMLEGVAGDDQFPFEINTDSGAISVGPFSPDPDIQDVYNFNVSARDGGMPPLSAAIQAQVTVYVTASTVRSPEFTSPDYVRIPEDAQRDSLVVELTANHTCDAPVAFFIVFPPFGDFDIQDGTNQIVVERTPLTVGNHSLQLRALCVIDDLRGTQVLTIEVVDLNSPPKFVVGPSAESVVIYLSEVAEDAGPSSQLSIDAFNSVGIRLLDIAIQAEDPDVGANGTLSFRLTDNPGENDNELFRIDSASGAMSVIGGLDFDLGPRSYSFLVEVVDGGDPPLSASETITISVKDANDIAPKFERDMYAIEVPEDIQPGTVFFTIRAVDNDTDPDNRRVIYRMSDELFAIDNSTGGIFTTDFLDRETRSTYNRIAIASDGVGQDTTDIVITVTDVNDQPPVFNQTMYSTTLTESYQTDVVFLQVFTTDEDEEENARASYSIIEHPAMYNITHIDSNTGELSFIVSPDYEFSPQLELQVQATDVGNPSLSAVVTVAITLRDINDNSPVFTEQIYSAQVRENRPSGTFVVRVEASDDDSELNGVVSYAIVGEEEELFEITNGVVTTKASFNREMNSSFEIVVVATDSGVPRRNSTTTVNVRVLDENDERPMFDSEVYTVQISEFKSSGFKFLTVKAEDGDEGTNAMITYRLSRTDANDFAALPNSDGSVSLSLQKSLNYESENFYNFSLRAFDGGFPSLETSATIIVEVVDENDNPPMFNPSDYEEDILENATAGEFILSVFATDIDVSDVLVYSIKDGASFPEFLINSSTGSIYVAGSLDYENVNRYELEIMAADQTASPKSASASVIINVIDVNDNPPYFLSHNSTQFVTENNQPGQMVFRLQANDEDSASVSVPGRRVFSIDSGNTNNAFEIDEISGDVSVTQILDREDISSYFITISVADNGSPSLTGSTNVTVIVQDVNDNTPTGGHQDIYLYLLNGKAPIVTLGQVFVNDSDIINEHTYTVTDNPSDSLSVLPDGSIQVNSETPASSTITVRIRDGPNGEAVTTISSVIRNITSESLADSFEFSMQFARISPQNFVDNILGRFLNVAVSVLRSALPHCGSDDCIDLQVFSIQESVASPGNLDVFILVEDTVNEGFVHRTLVQHILHINRQMLEEELKVDIVTEFVDLCSSESCSPGLTCSNDPTFSSTDNISFGSRSITYLGLATDHSTQCEPVQPPVCETLRCIEPAYCMESGSTAVCQDSCSPNPCKNGGSCQPQSPGYYCVCPASYDGRNCELTGATFNESSYAIFPSIATQQTGTISLEVIASLDSNNGLLFYVGRFDSLYNDFLALELIDGLPSVTVSYGAGASQRTSTLEADGKVNNFLWHQITIDYTTTVSYKNQILSVLNTHFSSTAEPDPYCNYI